MGRPDKRVQMREPTFEGYRRRIDAVEYRAKRRDVPRDVATLLELAGVIELEDKIILDRTDNGE